VAAQAARRAGDVCMKGRARAERTLNMPLMSVTLDVSKLSGWLNADARCRRSRKEATHAVRGLGWPGGRRVCGATAA
jgi:hypothetical protein